MDNNDMEMMYRWKGMFECSIIPMNHVEAMQSLLKELQERCESCTLFEGINPDRVWVYTINDVAFVTSDGPAMLAIAKYGNSQAVVEPKYLTKKQWQVVHYLVERIVDRPESYVVFTKELYQKFFSAGCRNRKVILYE